jgi:phosphoribosylformylglycinamidine synthase
LRLPIAHAEGRYFTGDLDALEGQVALRYCTPEGVVNAAANPNGSVENIAAIYGGPERNVLGLMPHPERMSEPLHGGEDGRRLFEAVSQAILTRSAAA